MTTHAARSSGGAIALPPPSLTPNPSPPTHAPRAAARRQPPRIPHRRPRPTAPPLARIPHPQMPHPHTHTVASCLRRVDFYWRKVVARLPVLGALVGARPASPREPGRPVPATVWMMPVDRFCGRGCRWSPRRRGSLRCRARGRMARTALADRASVSRKAARARAGIVVRWPSGAIW